MHDRQHFHGSWFVCTRSVSVTLAVSRVFTLWRAENVPNRKEMIARNTCGLNPEISNADVASVLCNDSLTELNQKD